MLTHTQSLRSLSLVYPLGLPVKGIAVAVARSGLKNNITLRELTLDFSRSMTTSSILTSLREHPLPRRLCLKESVVTFCCCAIPPSLPLIGFQRVLRTLARRFTPTKLGLHGFRICHDETRLLRKALCSIQSLQRASLLARSLGQRVTKPHTPLSLSMRYRR
jgi:hypothetical protein